jgi:hypothetical protein
MHISDDLAPLAADRVRPSMSDDWYIESLRLTFFEVAGWTQRQTFTEISGVVPTQINAQPPMQLHQEVGDLGDAYLSVAQQGNRIDVILSDQPTRNIVDPALPGFKPLYWIGPFNQSIELFAPISARAVSLMSGAGRLAYAMTLVHNTATVRDAIISLRRYLPTVDFDPDNDLDLSFQINRPTRDKRGRLINRFARWDTIQVMSMLVAIPPALPMPSRPSISAARIYVDVSTDANNTSSFSGSELSELVDELRSYAISVAQNGDSK